MCYNNVALDARKANKPVNSALGLAAEMGIELLTEEDYRQLQAVMKLDEKLPVGSRPRNQSGSSMVRFSVIAAMTRCLPTTTEPSPIMDPEVSVASWKSKKISSDLGLKTEVTAYLVRDSKGVWTIVPRRNRLRRDCRRSGSVA